MKNLLFSIVTLLAAASMMNANADSFDFDHARPGTPRYPGPGMDLPGNDFGDDFFEPSRPDRPGRTERLVIQYGDQHFRGSGNVLMLKREIKNMYPRMNLQNFSLESVRLVAKSKMGRGQAELVVGRSSQDRRTIGGSPRDFQSARPYTFDRIDLYNYDSRAQGRWQIHLNGNIKVRKVVVFLQRERVRPPVPPRPPRVSIIEIGTDKADKVIADRESFRANQGNVSQIILEGRNEVVDIKEVVVVFGNGEHRQMYELTGYLRDGESRRAQLYNLRNVQKVIVTATSPQLIGSRGKYAVKLGIAR